MAIKTKKKVRRKRSSLVISPKDLIPADYNPRIMDQESKAALKKSMSEFSDISGITWNKTTGNIVTGHHRWEQLVEAHSIANLTFKLLSDDKHSIISKEGDTGFILRTVEWNKSKEMAANITANSPKVEGIFTTDLSDVLDDIQLDLSEDLFSELRLDDMVKDMDLSVEPPAETKNDIIQNNQLDNDPKSATLISAGGDKFKTIKLEVAPSLAKRFEKQLNRFKTGNGVLKECLLKSMVLFLEKAKESDIKKFKGKRQ